MDGWKISYDELGNVFIEITSDGDTYEWELSSAEAEVLLSALFEALYSAKKAVENIPRMPLA